MRFARTRCAMVLTASLAIGVAGPAMAETSRTYDLPGFDRVRNGSSLDVVVTRGAQSVTASGPADLLDRLDITVSQGTLHIRMKDKSWSWWKRDDPARVRVSLPALRGAAVNGSGNMDVTGGSGERFQAGVNGSGDITLREIGARSVELAVNGSGNLRIAGRATEAAMAIKGSGDIDAVALPVETAQIAVDGSGNVTARASRQASLAINGSGDVVVQGTGNCTKAVRGSGNATCRP